MAFRTQEKYCTHQTEKFVSENTQSIILFLKSQPFTFQPGSNQNLNLLRDDLKKLSPIFVVIGLVCLFVVCLGCGHVSTPLMIPPSAYPAVERPRWPTGTSFKGKQWSVGVALHACERKVFIVHCKESTVMIFVQHLKLLMAYHANHLLHRTYPSY